MELWRLARSPFAALDGEGARRFGGRWNSPGRPMVYLAEHPALAILEVLANLDVPMDLIPVDYVALKFSIPDDIAVADTDISPLTKEARSFRNAWLAACESALLRAPSVLAPESWNYLLNPAHPNAKRITEAGRHPFRFDPRLADA